MENVTDERRLRFRLKSLMVKVVLCQMIRVV